MHTRQKLSFFYVVILASSALVGYAIYKTNRQQIDSAQWVEHTRHVIAQSGKIRLLGNDVLIASRDFIITGDTGLLKPFYKAEKTIPVCISQLKHLTRDNPAQQQRLDSLSVHLSKLLYFSTQTIALIRSTNFNSRTIFEFTTASMYEMSEIQKVVDEIESAETTLLAQRKSENKQCEKVSNWFLAIISILTGVLTISLLIGVDKYRIQNKENERRAEELVIANEELVYQSEEKEKRAGELIIAYQKLIFQNNEKEKRTDELVIANEELAMQNADKEKSKIELKFANVELEKTKAELQQTLKGIKKIMDASYDVICSIDENGKFVNVSVASELIWGYKFEELTGSYFTDIVFDEDVKKTDTVLSEVMSGLPATIFENRCIHKNGNVVSMLWSKKWDEIDQLNYCIGKDISEKKILENAFEQQQRQRIYDMFINAPSSIGIVMGPDHIYEMVNPLYLNLIGKKDIIGKSVREVPPELVEQDFIKILDNVYNTG